MSKQRAPLAKLTRPRLHAPVKRTRLFKLLDRGTRHPITWVSGPPGAGKTTLVASYLEARKARTFWYQVDEGDRDPASLFYYLNELAKPLRGRKREALPYLTAEYLPDLAGFARRYFRELFRRLGSGSVLVFDNCQDAASEPFHLILREACQEIAPECQLIALSRGTPPAELSREITNNRLQLLAWPQLRLTDDEAAEIVKDSAASVAIETSALNQRCDGWVGGLVLLLARNAADAPNAPTRAFDSQEALFNYFAEEVLSRTAPEAQRLLLETSLFPYTTVSMALQLTTIDISEHVLSTLYNKQYFIDRKIEGELTYQYHDLFREFLLRRLTSTYQPARLSELRQRAAQILEKAGRLSDATDLFKQSQDWRAATRLIRAHAEALFNQGRWQTLNAWFESVPEPLINDDPWLLFWRASAQSPLDAAAAYDKLRRVQRLFAEREDQIGEFYALSSLTLLAYEVGTSFAVFDEWLPRLEHQLTHIAEFASIEVGANAWMAYLSMILLRIRSGSLVDTAEQWLSRHYFAGEMNLGNMLLTGDQLLHQALWTARGDFGERICAKLLHLIERDDAPPPYRYHPIKDLGYWHFFNAEFAQALPFFERAAELVSKFGMPEQYTYVQCYRAMALCGLDEAHRAEAIMQQVAASAGGDDVYSSSAVNWAWGSLHAARGDYAAARQRVSTAAAQARAKGFVLLELIVDMPLLSYAVQLGDGDETLAILTRVRELTRDTIWCFPDCLLGAVEAEVYRRRGERERALGALRQALQYASNPRLASWLVWAKPWLSGLLAFALSEGVEAETVKQLIRHFKLAPPERSDASWPWPVVIRTLGPFELYVDNAPIAFSAKAPKKTLALLKAIVAFGAHEVRAEDLLDALWGDSESDAAREALKITLLRLRRLLGSPDAIVSQQGRLSLNPELVWVDALAFEASANRAATGEVTDVALDSALTLYRGNFLAAEEDCPWAVLSRERLRRKFVQLVGAHAQILERAGEHASAAALYARGLDADNLIEQFYQGLMRSHAAQGQHAEGMDVYRRLRQLLSVTLGVAPAAESQALFATLQQRAAALSSPS